MQQTTSSQSSSTAAAQPAKRKPKTALWIMLTILFGLAALAMSGLYLWNTYGATTVTGEPTDAVQLAQCKLDVQDLEQEKSDLQKELSDARADVQSSNDQQNDVLIKELPVVVFERAGLGDQELFDEFQQKLVEPLRDWNLDQDNVLLSLSIEIPENIGEDFIYNAIYEDGQSEGALFGKRGEPLDWWVPGCMGECKFSDEFKEKYPEVIEAYESAQ